MKSLILILSLIFSRVTIAHTTGAQVPRELVTVCSYPEHNNATNILFLNLIQPVEAFGNSVEVVFALDTADCIEGQVQPAAADLQRALITNPAIPGFSQIAVAAKLSHYRYAVQINLPADFVNLLSQTNQKFNVSVEFKDKTYAYCLLVENSKFSLKKSNCP